MHACEHWLIVVSHPDDEVLGCGGVISRLVKAGHEVDILVLTDGTSARNNGNAEAASQRKSALELACRKLGCSEPIVLDFVDQQLDAVPMHTVASSIEQTVECNRYDYVITHSMVDLNHDHRVTHEATMVAFRPYARKKLRGLFGLEVLSSTEISLLRRVGFSPTLFVDVSPEFARKIDALEYYSTEIRQPPHPRSIEIVHALSRLRGSMCGAHHAEAFEVYFNKLV